MKGSSLIIIVLLGLFGVYGCNKFNGLSKKDEAINKEWANLQAQYQRRLDLIPNLVNTVQGAAEFEKSTLSAVIEARSKATSVQLETKDLTPENMEKFKAAQEELKGTLSRLMVSVEQYPNLKANQNFLELQSQLEGTENRISIAREDFNKVVGVLNEDIRLFPGNIIAGVGGFKKREYYEASQAAQNAPTVDFNKK